VEKVLSGGNTHEEVVRVGDTVRRPTGPWTPGVHALLVHLQQKGFDGAPRVHGIDERGHEVLDYIEGEVVHPDHLDRIESDAALAEVVSVIRHFHDAASSFPESRAHAWSDRGSDPTGSNEILCHNDLAPWNLVRSSEGRWVFIDWDLAAPGRRSWDLAWALLSFVPLMPESNLDDMRTRQRIAVFTSSYGVGEFPEDVLSVAVERCRREAELIHRLGAAGEMPYARLLAEGHREIWSAAATHIASRSSPWSAP
jgi:Phosphotransferase enzyme family